MRAAHSVLSFVVCWIALSPVRPAAQVQPVLAALQEELKRSMDGLRMKDQPAPYYIAYRVDDLSTANAVGSLGALVQDVAIRSRTLQVEVRVGDYTFDSSRFISGAGPAGVGSARLPVDDDPTAMRRQIWLTTDAAYKRAVNVFSRKKAAFQNRAEPESIPDFSYEPPIERLQPPLAPAAATGPWAERVQQISAVFLSTPDVQGSDVIFSETRGTRYFVTSEGTKVVSPVQSAMVRILGETLAIDGTAVRDSIFVVAGATQDLPSADDLMARTRDLTARLSTLRRAPAGEAYAGPVLVEGEGSAELLAMTFAPMLTSRRPADTENPRSSAGSQSMMSPYVTRLGSRVLPESFFVTDTPSLAQYGGSPVPGAYAVDDEGVPAKDVTLIDNGMLQTLLTTRTPQHNLLRSNGHSRGSNAQPAVFQMHSERATPSDTLRQKYLDMLKQQGKPFGYIVRSVANPSSLVPAVFESAEPIGGGTSGPGGTVGSPQILRVVKVTPDGKEDPVRGLQFGQISHTAFRTIAESSTERPLYNTRIGGNVVSMMVPSLIFEDLEIQRNRGVAQKAPIVPSPIK
jgi:hypothetical protein